MINIPFSFPILHICELVQHHAAAKSEMIGLFSAVSSAPSLLHIGIVNGTTISRKVWFWQ